MESSGPLTVNGGSISLQDVMELSIARALKILPSVSAA